MAMAEDAASVLEQFVQDVANLPAEVQHLLEEIQAKDRGVQECRSQIATRDNNIQKFLKTNGAGQANPKEESYSKAVAALFEKAQALQDEKVSLSEKASLLLDRQMKRLDFKIRDLQNEGAIQPDPQLPSLLNNSAQTRLPSLTSAVSGSPTPLQSVTGNAGPSTTIANNPITRLVQPSARQPSPLSNAIPSPNAAAAGAAPHLTGRGAQRSPSTDPSKRRRLNPHQLTVPAQSSNLRQSSLGPGTPKGNETGSRASSAQPSRPSNKAKPAGRSAPHSRINALASASAPANKKVARRRGGNKKSGTPASMTGEEDSVVEGDEENEDVEMEDGDDEGEGDDKKYCICHSVSYGNMVACDNDDCPNEWFHWSCVGVKEEPKGKWYCPDCRRKLGVR